MTPRVLSPGEMAAFLAEDGPGRRTVAGRVVRVEAGAAFLADALGAARVPLPGGFEASPGDLVEVELERDARAPARGHARSARRWRAPAPSGEGEVGRLLLQGGGARIVARARALQAVRGWLSQEGFVEVETPTLIPAPGLDPHVEPWPARGGHLVPSPEHALKRLLVGGLPRVAEVARCARSDEVGDWHEPEFTLLEWYRSFEGLDAVRRDTEAIVVRVALAVGGAPELKLPDGRKVALEPPFPRVTVREAFEAAGGPDPIALAERDPDGYHRWFVERVEPWLARAETPLFLERYPRSEAALARLAPDDPTVAERSELWVGGVELCNAYDELTNAAELAERWRRDALERERRGLPTWGRDERLLAALEEGMPPAAGNALGLDRLVALALGARGVAEVRAIPWRVR